MVLRTGASGIAPLLVSLPVDQLGLAPGRATVVGAGHPHCRVAAPRSFEGVQLPSTYLSALMKHARSVPSAATPKAGLRSSGPTSEITVAWLHDSPPSGDVTNTSRPLAPIWKSPSRVTTPSRPSGSF